MSAPARPAPTPPAPRAVSGDRAPRRRLRSLLARSTPALSFALVVAAGAATVAVLGVGTVLVVVGAATLLLLGFAAAAVTSLALTLRSRLSELRHLPDLGHRFVTEHEHARITAVGRDGNALVLHVTSDGAQTMVLDESGAPDHVESVGAGTATYRIPDADRLDQGQRRLVQELVGASTPATVTTSGIVGLAGPVATEWRIRTEGGLVIAAGA